MPHFPAAIPLSLYIHIPWCVRKCPYCDFNSHQMRSALPERSYIDALLLDLERDLPRVGNRPIESVFIGGGTPSLFSAEAIERLLTEIGARATLSAGAEITLEVNPGTLGKSKLQELRGTGVNRLSIGVQSFNPVHLQRLGRIHDRQEAIGAVESAQAAGFSNINVDLMFGLPDQSLDQALNDVKCAIALKPTHVSHYQLTLEPGTGFHKHPPTLPGDDLLWAMQEHCQRYLADCGLAQYEVSAYACPGWRCRHNLNYWRFGDYIGIGAGAHGKISDFARGHVIRTWKRKNPRDYMKHAGTPLGSGETGDIPGAELRFEFMLNALRLTQGISKHLFEERTGLSAGELTPVLGEAQARGLLHENQQRIQPTAFGHRFLNDLLELFLPEVDRRA